MEIRDPWYTVENVITDDSQWDKFYNISQDWKDI